MMFDKPQLQLDPPPPGLVRTSRRAIWLLAWLQILTLVAVGLLLVRGALAPGILQNADARLAEIRATAIALEDRSLPAAAAAAWEKYLHQFPTAADRVQVRYRIGKLLMDAEDFQGAVAALVAAEQLAAEDEPLRSKIGPKIVQCLRRLGRYGEVGRELSRQVEIGGGEAPQVLATFAGERFTAADLDRVIQRTVDRALALQPQGRQGRAELLQQYQSTAARQQLLQKILQRELFSRRARELNLDQEDAFRQTLELVSTELLASQLVSRELAKIQPTDVDLESYYAAHPADYRQPAQAEVIVLPLTEAQPAAEVLANIQTAEDFRRLADEANGQDKLSPVHIVAGKLDQRLGDPAPLLALDEGTWTKQPVIAQNKKYLVLVESKMAATTPPLSQIRSRVAADYYRKKQHELMQQLSADLMSRYDVKIYDAARAANLSGTEDAPAATATEENE